MMYRPLLHLLFLCLPLYALAQQSDFISFRKKDRTLKTFFKGMPIQFIHTSGSYVNGIIEKIDHDTLYIKQYDVRMIPTPWGTRVQDTISHYDLRFHYREIAAIPRPPRSFEFIRNGTLFMICGGGYAFLHTFNGLIQKAKISPPTLAISGAVAAAGFTMLKLRKHYYPIGEKYKIVYVPM
ncbi:MAG: hypothetical protein M9933_01660 [Chitinophagaceae bacterium]|nr:hypothetical protein [Chitinophagaceae bacterium]